MLGEQENEFENNLKEGEEGIYEKLPTKKLARQLSFSEKENENLQHKL